MRGAVQSPRASLRDPPTHWTLPMRQILLPLTVALIVAMAPLHAATPPADGAPEITRGAITPQAVGTVHTLRQIPEACTRIEGVFTGDAATPYRQSLVRTSANCQPRARFVEAAQAGPSVADGWILNDVLRVPRADCPAQQAVVRVWRRPAAQDQTRDGQGQARIYLDEAKRSAAAGTMAPMPMFTAEMSVEGAGCG